MSKACPKIPLTCLHGWRPYLLGSAVHAGQVDAALAFRAYGWDKQWEEVAKPALRA